jgi:transcriptional regulator with GAF, ATPase, and Fis domain
VEITEALARINTHLAFHKLQRQLETRTQELSSLLKLSQSLTSTLKLEPLASLVLDQLKTVVDYTGGAIVTLAKDELAILAYRGPSPQEVILNLRFSTQGLPLALHLSSGQEPLIIADLRTDKRLLRLFQQVAGEKVAPFLDYTRAWMGVPLVAREQLIGLLSLSHIEPNYYTPYHSELVSAFAGQAAIAIDNAHLYQQARQTAAIEERHRLARDLHDSVTQALYGPTLNTRAPQPKCSSGLKSGEDGLRFQNRNQHKKIEGLILEDSANVAELRYHDQPPNHLDCRRPAGQPGATGLPAERPGL